MTVIRFAGYHLRASSSTYMTDSMYLGTCHICRDLNERCQYLISTTSMIRHRCKSFPFPVAEYASFSHQGRTPKTNLQGLILNFSEYYFKTGTICRLYLSSHVFFALGFDSNHFGTPL